jgi:hypothetical protein
MSKVSSPLKDDVSTTSNLISIPRSPLRAGHSQGQGQVSLSPSDDIVQRASAMVRGGIQGTTTLLKEIQENLVEIVTQVSNEVVFIRGKRVPLSALMAVFALVLFLYNGAVKGLYLLALGVTIYMTLYTLGKRKLRSTNGGGGHNSTGSSRRQGPTIRGVGDLPPPPPRS